MTVLVTGARGRVGRLVVDGLRAAGTPVRAASRDPRPGDDADGLRWVRMDLADPATLPAALDGVDAVFLYARPQDAAEFAAAAKRAGIGHVVVLSSASVLMPDAGGSPIARAHRAVEDAIDGAGLPRTFLRPAYFSSNALRWTSIRTDRRLRTAFPEARTSTVHERDIAEVGVAALLRGPEHAAHALLGAGRTTVREQVAAIAGALGEPVEVERIDVDAFRAEQARVLPAPIVDLLVRQRGDVAAPPPEVAVDAVEPVLGRPPLEFARWARDHADEFR